MLVRLVQIWVWWNQRPTFFENEKGATVIVNGERYRVMLTHYFFEEIEDMDNIWFQQDGATSNIANATIDLLHPIFKNRIISKMVM